LRLVCGRFGVVVDPPFYDDLASFVEVGEQVLVKALVAVGR
jgi:hypothetical protein